MQVLSDGTHTYLYGNGRIVQYTGTTPEYFLPDALGSVRQLAGASGSVTLVETYQPYGEILSQGGAGQSPYGYAGEWTDTEAGLVYLRARHYSPYLNQFIQPDPIVPNPYHPWEWKRYTYARNNPLRYTDPSGYTPECSEYERSDLTEWLVDELNTNRYNLIAGYIKENLRQDPVSQGLAIVTWWDVVKTHAIWDFKQGILKNIGRSIKLVDDWYSFEVPANIHFGYLGVYVGFDKYILHCGADFATNGEFCSGADSISDYEFIEAGFDIYKLSGGGEVNKYILRAALAAHPSIDKGEPASPINPAFQIPWPYPAGTFDDGSSGLYIKHRGPFLFPGAWFILRNMEQ